MPKTEKPRTKQRHAPLGQQIMEADAPRATARVKQRTKQREQEEEEDIEQYVESKMTKKILKQAREQQNDDEVSDDLLSDSDRPQAMPDSDAEEQDEDGGELFEGDDMQYETKLNIAPEDEAALQMFMSKEPSKRATLSDMIMGKIKEKETEIASQMSDTTPTTIDERIKRVYESVGEILSKYRSGKLPKAFKIISSLKNWEEVLQITQPENWTAAAMFQATKIFASNLNSKMAQRFYNLVLYPRVRDDIAEYKRLNFQLFMSLKKALFKPAAFYKGILLPLCEAGDCTMKEAVIVSGALARTSIPALQSAAAMLKIAEMPYNGANSIFLRVLLDKKYALPYRVIDALVFHFLRFQADKRLLPVLWHQCLLVFVQRYKEDISSEQKDALLGLLKAHAHAAITPEIRRELLHSKSRDAEQTFVEGRPEAMEDE